VFLCYFLQNVHHAGQPMPGEEQEDLVVTGTQISLRNVNCPLTMIPVTELKDPVRWYGRFSSQFYSVILPTQILRLEWA
jgi:hypothetical protein